MGGVTCSPSNLAQANTPGEFVRTIKRIAKMSESPLSPSVFFSLPFLSLPPALPRCLLSSPASFLLSPCWRPPSPHPVFHAFEPPVLPNCPHGLSPFPSGVTWEVGREHNQNETGSPSAF